MWKLEISKLLGKEEQMWKQRSRALWLQEGDNNTKFFHSRASHQFRRNCIDTLEDPSGEDGGGVPCSVTEEMNEVLNGEYTKEEVVTALNQMEPLKSPGPDGLPPLFFQHYWPSMGADVTEAVIANRLKGVLPLIISESQSAFQSDKAISDNILVAFETLHHMKNQKSKKGGFMALKLDMSKAYDRVEWSFLEVTMLKMGFDARWVALILSCINSASYSILVNGVPKGDIRPLRGSRFEAIRGFSLYKNGPKISHLFFADDTVLFCQATKRDLDVIQSILVLYEKASGQKLNREKTSVFFSKATPTERKIEIINELGVSEVREYEKYLGLPAVVGRNKKASLNFIKERVWNKLQGWKEKLLSQAGREVLLKAVVQAIPTFAMGCFKLPSGLLHDIEMMIRKFWWGQRGDQLANLLEPGGGGWNEQLVDDIFLPFEAQRIKSIPLCVTVQEDCLSWPRCRSGSYSVKSGYQLLCETEMNSLPSSSDSEVFKRFWKDIWRLKVPNKVKVFLWRACSRALPTKVNLQKRRVVDNSTCDQCGCMTKDEFHALWDCEMVREAWAPAFGEVRRKGLSLKVMSDLEAGIGVVIRNNEGQVLVVLSEKVQMPVTVEVLEMLAARKAAMFARDLGFSQVCFEGDAELVVKCLHLGMVSNALVGHLVKDFMSIGRHFQSSNVIHVRRQGNNVAHALARDSKFSFPLRVWTEEVPPNISCFVVRDLP
ncbi:uncharacterized protein LOC126705233 [Quercus robur]|uniref:uncharacterized protein LOC126705233 n=1 Tax=Quercus robur TaxID=38942 RepID=UPI002162B7A6|nr:uncharacterized protein LOC126705233 [Quercus robur]